jgi:hypothetical protein
MDNKPWYQSKTIWASVVGACCSALALIGHKVDPGTQEVLVNNLTDIINAAAIILPILAAIFRSKATTTLTSGANK